MRASPADEVEQTLTAIRDPRIGTALPYRLKESAEELLANRAPR